MYSAPDEQEEVHSHSTNGPVIHSAQGLRCYCSCGKLMSLGLVALSYLVQPASAVPLNTATFNGQNPTYFWTDRSEQFLNAWDEPYHDTVSAFSISLTILLVYCIFKWFVRNDGKIYAQVERMRVLSDPVASAHRRQVVYNGSTLDEENKALAERRELRELSLAIRKREFAYEFDSKFDFVLMADDYWSACCSTTVLPEIHAFWRVAEAKLGDLSAYTQAQLYQEMIRMFVAYGHQTQMAVPLQTTGRELIKQFCREHPIRDPAPQLQNFL